MRDALTNELGNVENGLSTAEQAWTDAIAAVTALAT